MDPSILMMNPFVDIHIHPQPEAYPLDADRIEKIVVKCPVRGHGLRIHDLTRASEPDLFRFFLHLVEKGGELELDSDAPLVESLTRLGFLLTADDVVDWPRFEVLLDTPAEAEDAPPVAFDRAWIVSDEFLFQSQFALHPAIRWPGDYDAQEGRLRCFGPGPAFWLGDPDAFTTPYWLTSEQASWLTSFAPGETPPPLPPQLARALISAGAIVRRDEVRAPALASFESARSAFATNRYACVRDLLPAAELRALRRYYGALLRAGLVAFGDKQHAGRFSMYNDPVGRFVHARLSRVMSAIAAQPVAPSFSFFFSYVKAGIALEPHKDRPQAEFSISLQLDYSPEPVAETGWPLGFSFADGGSALADLRIGDAAFYHGRELTHYRAALPAGHESSHLVLEYVPHDFRGLLI